MRSISSTIWLGTGILAFALFLHFFLIPTGISKPSNIRVAVLSPTFWPYIVVWGIGLGGLLLVAQGAFARMTVREAGDETGRRRIDGGPWLRLLAIAIIMVVYYTIIPVTGLVLASMMAFLAIVVVTRSRYRITAVIAAVVLPLAVYGFFNHVAGVPIPQGQWIRLP